MKSIAAFLLVCAGMAQLSLPNTEPKFRPLEDYFMIFPMIEKDFDNWRGEGTAVFLKDKLVLTPGAGSMKGLVHTTTSMEPEAVKSWEVQVDLDMGNDN